MNSSHSYFNEIVLIRKSLVEVYYDYNRDSFINRLTQLMCPRSMR
jgi:hypothetical protein